MSLHNTRQRRILEEQPYVDMNVRSMSNAVDRLIVNRGDGGSIISAAISKR